MARSGLEVADVFRRYGEAYRQRHDASLSAAQRRVMTAIELCRTAALVVTSSNAIAVTRHPSPSQLTSPPETIPSCARRPRHRIPTTFRTAPYGDAGAH